MNRVINGTADGKVTIDKIKYDAVRVWANETKYDDEKLAEVESIQADALVAIRAAETVEAVDAAFLEAYAKYDAVPTKTQ